jgi:hypothetical protein
MPEAEKKKVEKPLQPVKKPTLTKTKVPVVPPLKPVEKQVVRTSTKKPGYNPFDRLSLRKRKPDMKDAWTQTTPRPRDERRNRRQKEEKEKILLKQQQEMQGM